MRQEVIADLRVQLLAAQHEYAEVVVAVRSGIAQDSRDREPSDTGDKSQHEVQQAVGVAVINNRAAKLGLINQALARIRKGSYGVCLACPREIPLPRLQAIPWAPLCRDCQEACE